MLQNNDEISPNEILIRIAKSFVIDGDFPSLNFISSFISRSKTQIYGPNPKNLSSISKDEIEKIFPNFLWAEFDYKNNKKTKKYCCLHLLPKESFSKRKI